MLITPEILLKFSSFQQLSEQQLKKMLSISEIKLFQSMPGEKIITRGTNDNFSFFLVSGALKLIAKDGQTAIIKADSDSAKQPITQLKPRQYDVVADDQVTYLKMSNQVLDNLNTSEQKRAQGIQVDNDPGNADIYFQLYHDIKNDHIFLPSLPAIASHINRTIAKSVKIDARRLSQLILVDPVITVKLIKLAISRHEINVSTKPEADSISSVISDLGLAKSAEIVQVFSAKDIFTPFTETQEQMAKDLWQETLFISIIATELAAESEHLSPQKAQLIGLTHNIGSIIILNCLGKDISVNNDVSQMAAITTELGGNISVMLLEKWGFPPAFIEAAKDAQNWHRSNESHTLDYSDLIIIAKLLSAVATPKIEHLPVLTELPVFRKLHWDDNGVARGLQILSRARQHMQKLLQGFDNI